MLKRTVYLKWVLLGLIFAFSYQHYGQTWIAFTGSVTNEANGDPIANYPVMISAADSASVILTITNQDGFYLDSLFINPAQTDFAQVEVIDCKGIPVVVTFQEIESINVADFNICVNQFTCLAYFEYELLEGNIVQFQNLSEGDFTSSYWDFGDLTTSMMKNPTHKYEAAGTYFVTLAVADSLSGCFDNYSEWILIGDTLGCSADFTFVLDSLSNDKNTYYFEDQSSGNPQFYLWDFGDGNSSNEQNPVHTYDSPGTYTVCLTITSENAGVNCEDKYCSSIATPQYYNFGGHVFLGEYPLNVDETDTSNIAIASLYKRMQNQWYFMDSREFWKFGYYWFADKPAGEYLVRVDLLPGSSDYGLYAPSYYGNTIGWANAQSFTLNGEEVFDVNVRLQPMAIATAGVGSIGGSLEQGLSCVTGISTEGTIIYLFDGEGDLIDYTYSAPSGTFFFDGLPSGLYSLKLEMTGKFGERSVVNLTDSKPSVDNLVLQYDCNAFVGVEENDEEQRVFEVWLFPQPARDHINLEFLLDESTEVQLALLDMNGAVVFTEDRWFSSGLQQIMIDELNLNSGLYLLRIALTFERSVTYKKVLIYR